MKLGTNPGTLLIASTSSSKTRIPSDKNSRDGDTVSVAKRCLQESHQYRFNESQTFAKTTHRVVPKDSVPPAAWLIRPRLVLLLRVEI